MKRLVSLWMVPLLLLAAVSVVVAGDEAEKQCDPTCVCSACISGTWKLAKVQTGPDTEPQPQPENQVQLKIYTADTFLVVHVDKEKKAVAHTHGGPYKVDGKTVVETIEFANDAESPMIGNSFKIETAVKEGVMCQTITYTGMDNQSTVVTEFWERAK